MSYRRCIRPVILAASVLWAGALQAQERRMVKGVVVDATTGAPVPRVRVAASERRITLTDDEGRFTLCRLEPGTVMITAVLNRHDSVTAAASTTDPAPITLALTRNAAPAPSRAVAGSTRIILRPVDNAYQTIGLVIDGRRSVFSPSGCGEPAGGIPVVEQIGVEAHEVVNIEAVKGGSSFSPEFGLPLHGILVITTKRAPAP
jgi:hypothetical protein